jgi:citrate lyase beta subunit
LESNHIIYKENRVNELTSLSQIFSEYKDMILNIRIGGTDFSKYFGLRRQKQHTIYDLCTVRDCISDILNFFVREDRDFIVSAPVWEYFSPHASSPFELSRVFCDSAKGLINELILDKANGLIGKTVIHPSHIDIVHSLYVVEYEEYIDAQSILASDESITGAFKSDFSNKMNETKPHINWAKKIIKRSQIYGVYNHGFNYLSVI